MRATGALGATLALSAVLAGCAVPQTGTTASTPDTTSPQTSVSDSTPPPVVECPGEGEFDEGTGIANIGGEGSDGSHLRGISWETNDRCESFAFDFETSEGAPATAVPNVRIDHLDSFQVIRVRLDVDAAIITDQLVETPLVDRLYVVRALEGGMFVDLHLKEPAAARARIQSSPARLTIDLRPGFVPLTGKSIVGDRVVVVSPTRDAEVGLATLLSGYSRTFEAGVLVLVTQAGDVVGESSTTAADYAGTWGEFETMVTLPNGDVSMFVGEESPKDGTLEGVAFDLTAG